VLRAPAHSFTSCGKILVWNLFEQGRVTCATEPLFFVIPNCFSGEEPAFASLSASCSVVPKKTLEAAALAAEHVAPDGRGISELGSVSMPEGMP
jgi:hypothetical protein